MSGIKKLMIPVLGLLSAFLAGLCLLLLVGENPRVLLEALSNTLLSEFGLGYTLFYMTPLLFTGLSVAISFHCGLFNIGAEGQLYIGALSLIVISSLFPNLPPFWALLFGIAASLCGGGLWGLVAGLFKAKRGSHEVIVTILLNFIALFIVDYCVLYLFKDTSSQSPETAEIPSSYHLLTLFQMGKVLGFDLFKSIPVNMSLFLAIGASLLTYAFLFFTVRGYELRAVGKSITACRFAGISGTKNILIAFFLSGALAGLVGVNEVMGYQHDLDVGFSPQYGFTGIAVALLSRNHPLGIIASSFLFGALHNCSRELEFLSDKVTKELSLVLQATLIGFVASSFAVEKILLKLRRKRVA